MTNYYYKTNTTLSSIIKGTTNTNIQAAYGGTGGLIIATSTFSSVVTETPSTLNYSYQGTDISTSCIAYWEEGSSGTPTKPIWCTKIRAILVGGGGAGANGQTGNYVSAVNQNTGTISKWANGNDGNGPLGTYEIVSVPSGYNSTDVKLPIHDDNNNTHITNNVNAYNQRYNYYGNTHHNQYGYITTNHINTAAYQISGLGGGGGGGGGFLYLGETSIGGNTPTISFTPVASKGKTTTLTIGSSTWAALGGTNASGVTSGTGGSTSGTANQITDGENGTTATTPAAGSGGKCFLKDYASSLTYGKGGDGSNGVGGGGTPGNPGTTGTEYYRIYFLTG